jgi:hypothetical protein
MEKLVCKNCGNLYEGNFCNNCGQKTKNDRITVSHLFHSLLERFDINRGILYTAKMLFVQPGKVIQDYLNGKTKIYYNPISYLVVIASIYSLIMISFNIYDSSVGNFNEAMGIPEEQLEFQQKFSSIMKKFLSFISILMIPFYSLASYWIFKKRKLYYAEHMIVNSYLLAQYLLILTFLMTIFIFFNEYADFLFYIGLVVFTGYFAFGYQNLFKSSIFRSFISAIGVNILGMIMFTLVTMIITIATLFVLQLTGIIDLAK